MLCLLILAAKRLDIILISAIITALKIAINVEYTNIINAISVIER